MATFTEIKCSRESRPVIRCVHCMELRPFYYEREETKTKYCFNCVARFIAVGNGQISPTSIKINSSQGENRRLQLRLFKIVTSPSTMCNPEYVALAAKKIGKDACWVNNQLKIMRKNGAIIPNRLERCENFRNWLMKERDKSSLSNSEFTNRIAKETGYSRVHIANLLREEKAKSLSSALSIGARNPQTSVCDAIIEFLHSNGKSPYGSVERALCRFRKSAVRYAVQALIEMNKIQKNIMGGRIILSIAEEQK